MQFLSDNAAGVSRRVVDAVIAASQGAAAPYGDDPQTRHAERLLRETFECDDLHPKRVRGNLKAQSAPRGSPCVNRRTDAGQTPCPG